jgi:hypothetical protein
VNFVSDRISVPSLGDTLMPYDRSIDPVVRSRWIEPGFLTTDRSMGQTLFALVNHVRLGPDQASVTVLSMICR